MFAIFLKYVSIKSTYIDLQKMYHLVEEFLEGKIRME
jgi:hypothetical protein